MYIHAEFSRLIVYSHFFIPLSVSNCVKIVREGESEKEEKRWGGGGGMWRKRRRGLFILGKVVICIAIDLPLHFFELSKKK